MVQNQQTGAADVDEGKHRKQEVRGFGGGEREQEEAEGHGEHEYGSCGPHAQLVQREPGGYAGKLPQGRGQGEDEAHQFHLSVADW